MYDLSMYGYPSDEMPADYFESCQEDTNLGDGFVIGRAQELWSVVVYALDG